MFDTKPCRNRHNLYVTLYNGCTADGTASHLRFQVNRTIINLIQRFWNCTLMYTVRYGFNGILTMRFGVVFRHHNIAYGAVHCELEKLEIPRCGSVRFGAVFRDRKFYGAVRCGFQMS